ncbi:MAG: anaerobic sulfatase maturase [Oscillospiraceae bacterium]|nr:anaerobic sulfatase maturase [Oscillospiraceae bacterium]
MKSLNLLIKPASGHCNMRCRYCFYEDEISLRSGQNEDMMDAQTSETVIKEAFAAGAQESLTFAFQGGEPTMAGLDFFKNFVALVKKYNTAQLQISYAIQTNGLAIDEAWADFFVENGFLVGVSLDGNKAIHDSLRNDAAGRETWNRVTKNLAILQKKQVELNILCVVTKLCAKSPVKVYNQLKKLGVRYFQFIPCLDPLEVKRGSMPYSLTPDLYASFLCGLFDEWYRDWQGGNYNSVRLFDDYVHLMMGMPAGTCATSGSCGSYFVVEGNGSLYPCDFFCLDEWNLGKIGKTPLADLLQGEKCTRFLQDSLQHPQACATCRWKSICNGGCKRDWIRLDNENYNYFCPAFKTFFAHAEKRLAEIAQAELQAYKTAQYKG